MNYYTLTASHDYEYPQECHYKYIFDKYSKQNLFYI